MRFWKLCLIAASLAGASQSALAVTISCPGTDLYIFDREFRLTTASASTCVDYGSGNFDNVADGEAVYLAAGWSLLDKSDGSGEGLLDGALDIDFFEDDDGAFSIAASVWSAYSDVLFVMKSGVAHYDPDWAVFELASNTLGGLWDIDTFLGKANGLSHVNIYGRGSPTTQVAEPATLALFGAALAGLALRRRRRV